ncbi:MAG: InlB B-repeat-containing protein [Lachnospiraceae bacterium]|jgi:uncharacterized repeat protein (TIGR02543 family)
MRKQKRNLKKALSLLLCFVMFLGTGITLHSPSSVQAASIDVGANPKPPVDIAVNVPSDYPGTFLDFKQELTEKLIEQGMEPGSFRITNTKVDIDTTDLNGWYVYDHYRDASVYNGLGLSDAQKKMQPDRRSADSSYTNTAVNIEDYFKNGKFPNTVYNYNHHVYSYEKDGMSNMAFVGYATPGWMDFMLYPATSDSTRSFEFDLDASVLNNHTLLGGGFLMNSSLIGGKLYGYALYFYSLDGNNQPTKVCIAKLNGVDPEAKAQSFNSWAVSGSDKANTLGSQRKVHITVELKRDSVTVQQQDYDAKGNLGAAKDLYRNFALPQVVSGETLNGFGPVVSYANHGCAALSMFVFTNLAMSYEASAFDALQNVQYYQGADQKYFINLTGTNNDPGIPETDNQHYKDGINRMNENEIFYISNTDDGKIVRDSEVDEDGNIIKQGLGAENGFIANGDDYTSQIAKYIYEGYLEGRKFKEQKVTSDLPLANFYLRDANTEDEQIMTIHLQHLVNAEKYNQEHPTETPAQTTVPVNIVDKSRPGTLAGDNGKIAKWRLKVYDPNNTVVQDSGWVDDVSKIGDYVFKSNSAAGRWNFELTVRDNNDYESKAFQTYLVAFLDDEFPEITGANTGKNKATITLIDTGMGIDDDGITFIEDGRGSGVASYWVTNDKNAEPTSDDWITLPAVQHSYSFDVDIDDTLPIVVWTRDECGNEGQKAVFQPTRVVVKDPAGDIIDEYYVIGEKPIIVLPEEDDIPNKPEDEDEHFSGWEIEGGDPVTPGTDVPTGDDNTIVIKPSYSKEYAKLVYKTNGGTFDDGSLRKEQQVVENSSILKKSTDFDESTQTPTKEGYRFTGWKLLKNGNTTNSNDDAYINNAANLEELKDQIASITKNDAGDVLNDTYYLIAQWEIGNYTLNLNANGGSLGSLRKIENITYGTVLNNMTGASEIPTSGIKIPTKPGYIFQGWSETNTNDTTKIFKASTAASGITPVASPTMPASDKTIYAVWKQDTSKFIVSFDSNGGNTITDQAYLTASASNYVTFQTPQRAGYDFQGWYEKIDDGSGNISFGDTRYVGTEPLIKKANHSFIAKWSPSSSTRYTVDYYINSGNKDASGNYIYTKVNDAGVSKNHTAATESNVSVQEGEKTPELTVNGAKYWYNADHANNVLSGQVTGNPTLSLKLYYDRYFDVKVSSNNSHGTLNSAVGQKEGSKPSVSWKAADGYHVSKVMVDGRVRDDLLTTNGYTLETDIHENHEVYVVFVSDQTEEKPSPSPTPDPGGDDPVPPALSFYQIATSIVGCTDGSCTITDTRRIQAGEDASVEWTLGEGYSVTGITVDGIEYTNLSASSIDFKALGSNHTVKVTVSKMPTIGGGKTEGQYTVTVNRYGGDEKSSVSNSATVERNDKYVLTWDAGENHNLYKIYVNGVEQTGTMFTKDSGSRTYTVKENMVIDVYFAEKSTDPENPDPVVPTYPEDEYIKVTTQIVGGPGEITGGAVLKSDSDYTVNWSSSSNSSDPTASDYTYYEVVDVTVNGESKGSELSDVVLKNLTEDAEVVVKVAPVFYDIDLYKYGSGTISSSKTVYKGQSYMNINAAPEAGYSITKIVVDGTQVLYTEWVPDVKQASLPTEETVETNETAETSVPEDIPTTDAEGLEDASLDNELSVENNMLPQAEEGNPEENDAVPQAEEGNPEENGVQTEEVNTHVKGDTPQASETEETGSYQVRTDLSAVTKEDLNLKNASATSFMMEVDRTREDHVVEVFFTKNNEDGSVIPAPEKEDLFKVSAVVQGGPGEIAEGQGYYDANSDGTVRWSVPTGYTLESVTVNGKPVEVSGNAWNFEGINENKDVVVTLKKTGATNDPITPNYRAKTYNIETELVGGAGTITNSTTIAEGNTKEVKWEVTPVEGHNYEVKYVIVDGVVRTDLLTENAITLSADGNHKVVVVIDDKLPTDIDIDGDGNPDINIDTDKDGKPDVDVDTDGDGDPDINIDTDDDGNPDVNVDTDDDGKPDINIDTDDDGKPDINIDTDDDGKPDINIDTNGDGKPDINIDTNGDGKPDINVDIDGDGKPDVNIDIDGDGIADINIDADGDGIVDAEANEKVIQGDKINPTSTGANAPKTGDTSHPFVWIFISLLMLGVIGGFAVRQRKNRMR